MSHHRRWSTATATAAAGLVIAGTAAGITAGSDTADAGDTAVTTGPAPVVADRDHDGITDTRDPEPDNPFSPGDQDRDGDIDLDDARNEATGGPGSSAQQAGGAGDTDDDGVSDHRDPAPEDPANPSDRDGDGDVDNNDAYLTAHPAG